MKMLAFAGRNHKEILRDPLTLALSAGLPVALLLLFTLIQRNIPVEIFNLNRLAPAMAVFSLSFLCLFSGLLISKDRSTSFLMRLYASPLRAADYILGYALPMFPMALLQSALCLAVSVLLGYRFSPHLFYLLLALMPVAALFIGFGLLCGVLLPDKAVGGVNSLLINAAGLLGGMWFNLRITSAGFQRFAYALPFAHAVDMARAAAEGRYGDILPHLWWVLGYTAVVFAIVIPLFRGRMKNGTV